MKTLFILLCSLTLFFQFPLMQSSAQGGNPIAEFMDNNRKGFFAGGGFRYGTSRISDETVSFGGTSGAVEWRIGYATSNDLLFYITSSVGDFTPLLGVMAFSKGSPNFYYSGRIGYLSSEVDSGWVVEKMSGWNLYAGVGYEFRPHFTVELMGGYGRLKFDEADYDLETTSIFASFNYLFY